MTGLLYYGASVLLRRALENPLARSRLSAAHAVLGLAVSPLLFFFMPHMATFFSHSMAAEAETDPTIGSFVAVGILGVTALSLLMQNLRYRKLALPPDGDFDGEPDGI